MRGSDCGREEKQNQVCRPRGRIRRASLTIECAAVLPVFFMVCLTVIIFMDAVRIQSEQNLKLSNKARKLAVAASLMGEKAEGNWIDIAKTYPFEYPFPILGVPKLKIALRARVYPWIGSAEGIGGKGNGQENSGEQMIYVTDNKEVYHTHADCSHLDLTVIRTDMAGLKTLRNEYGRKYRKCKGFPKDYSGPVYVTAKGDYYYPSTEYGSLTRHVHLEKRSDHADLRECMRCAAKDRKEHHHAA